MQEDVCRGDGLNLYAYCGNNSVRYSDPSGYEKTAANCTKAQAMNDGGEDGTVYFGQQAVSPKFSEQGSFHGEPIHSVADKLSSGELSADDLPMQYIVFDGKKVTMNNRSLTALSLAGMKPSVLVDVSNDRAEMNKLLQKLKEMGATVRKYFYTKIERNCTYSTLRKNALKKIKIPPIYEENIIEFVFSGFKCLYKILVGKYRFRYYMALEGDRKELI